MKRLVFFLIFVLMTVRTAQSQVGPGVNVFDAANFTQNTISAVQAVLTTIEAVLIEANQILDLTRLDGVVVAGGIADDMRYLGGILESAQGLSYNVSELQTQINTLFDLQHAPSTRGELELRLQDIQRFKFEAYS